jgi:hypothetical protein
MQVETIRHCVDASLEGCVIPHDFLCERNVPTIKLVHTQLVSATKYGENNRRQLEHRMGFGTHLFPSH